MGAPDRAALPTAAYVNAVAIHALEVDDGYTRGSVHPSSAVLPITMAIAESLDASMDNTLRAYAIGAEIVCRIAEAGHPATYARGFHNTSLAGVIGAAAATASLLELDTTGTHTRLVWHAHTPVDSSSSWPTGPTSRISIQASPPETACSAR